MHAGANFKELHNYFTQFTDVLTNFVALEKKNSFTKWKVYNKELLDGFLGSWCPEDEVEVDDTEGTIFLQVVFCASRKTVFGEGKF